MSFILLAIACGWTLGRGSGMDSGIGMMHFGARGEQPVMCSRVFSRCSDLFIVMQPSVASVILLSMFLVHLVLLIWSAVGFQDDFDKFHDPAHTV